MKLNLNQMKYRVLLCSEDGKSATVEYINIPKTIATSIGNALRRSLLSDIPGYAPIAFRINSGNGATIDSVLDLQESIDEIGNNISGIRIKCLRPDLIGEFTLAYDGIINKNLLAKNLIPTGPVIDHEDYRNNPNFYNDNIKILNPDHIIFSNANADFENSNVTRPIEIIFNNGIGFTTLNDKSKVEKMSDSSTYHPVQSIYNPVKHAHFKVKENDGSKNYDDLHLSVETDGSISPFDAIADVSNLLASYFTIFANNRIIQSETPYYEFAQPIDTNIETNVTEDTSNNSPITHLEFTEDLVEDPEVYNALKIMGLNNKSEILEAFQKGKIKDFFETISLHYDEERFRQMLNESNIYGIKEKN